MEIAGCFGHEPMNSHCFSQEDLNKYADVMIWALKNARQDNGKGKMEPGDIVRIVYDLGAIDLIEPLYERCIKEGWHAVAQGKNSPRMERAFYDNANDDQLKFLAPWMAPPKDVTAAEMFDNTISETIAGYFYIFAPTDLHHLEGVPGDKIATSALTLKPYRDMLDISESAGEFGWALALYPTAILADEAGMTFKEYLWHVRRATYIDLDDPVAEWQKLYEHCSRVKKWLSDMPIDYLNVYSENIDLKVVIGEHRKWLGVSGHNIPSYETFISPDCRYTEGVYYADKKSLRDGNIVEGVRLFFKHGKVVEATADYGEDYLIEMLNMDDGARYIGEFSLTDKRFSKITEYMGNTLYDENVGGEYGNCHIAVGRGFESMLYTGDKEMTPELKEQLGFPESALHWDLINGENKTVTAVLKDGTHVVIYKDGMFTLE